MSGIRHKLLNAIKENIQLGEELDWIEERKGKLLGELAFDVVFNYDEPKRAIEKILMCYSDVYFDNDIREKNEELIKKLCELNKFA